MRSACRYHLLAKWGNYDRLIWHDCIERGNPCFVNANSGKNGGVIIGMSNTNQDMTDRKGDEGFFMVSYTIIRKPPRKQDRGELSL